MENNMKDWAENYVPQSDEEKQRIAKLENDFEWINSQRKKKAEKITVGINKKADEIESGDNIPNGCKFLAVSLALGIALVFGFGLIKMVEIIFGLWN